MEHLICIFNVLAVLVLVGAKFWLGCNSPNLEMVLCVHGLNRGTVSLRLFKVAVDKVCSLFTDVLSLAHTDHDVVVFLGVLGPSICRVPFSETTLNKKLLLFELSFVGWLGTTKFKTALDFDIVLFVRLDIL